MIGATGKYEDHDPNPMSQFGPHQQTPAIIRMSAYRGQSGNADKAAQPTLMTHFGHAPLSFGRAGHLLAVPSAYRSAAAHVLKDAQQLPMPAT
jgi:hypothetical protein